MVEADALLEEGLDPAHLGELRVHVFGDGRDALHQVQQQLDERVGHLGGARRLAVHDVQQAARVVVRIGSQEELDAQPLQRVLHLDQGPHHLRVQVELALARHGQLAGDEGGVLARLLLALPARVTEHVDGRLRVVVHLEYAAPEAAARAEQLAQLVVRHVQQHALVVQQRGGRQRAIRRAGAAAAVHHRHGVQVLDQVGQIVLVHHHDARPAVARPSHEPVHVQLHDVPLQQVTALSMAHSRPLADQPEVLLEAAPVRTRVLQQPEDVVHEAHHHGARPMLVAFDLHPVRLGLHHHHAVHALEEILLHRREQLEHARQQPHHLNANVLVRTAEEQLAHAVLLHEGLE
mmetsp:Transcript_44179/g.111325  ORF Transcript_44179/g.111325 Transcript_44179/m.111325 type:complete len:348 (-) Transcript_44179:242-1285(-)